MNLTGGVSVCRLRVRFGIQSSSMVERAAVNRDVVGSSPTSGANFPNEIGDSALHPKETQKVSDHLEDESEQTVNFPKRLRYVSARLSTLNRMISSMNAINLRQQHKANVGGDRSSAHSIARCAGVNFPCHMLI